MAERRATARFKVNGMSCGNCEQRIEKAVRALDGVNKVVASASLAEVTVSHDSKRISSKAIADAIVSAGYEVAGDLSIPARLDGDQQAARERSENSALEPGGSAIAVWKSKATSFSRFLGLLAVIAAIYLIIRYTVGFTFLPTVSQSMGYGLIFVVGLLTSLHCIAMCGGIVLSQGISKREDAQPDAETPVPSSRLGERLMPSVLYNGGRVVSYTIVGGIVGALGSLFSLSSTLKGIMPVIAGAFMLFLGVRMLGIFPWLSRLKVRFPGIGGDRVSAMASRRGPFVVGLLNGLMPCGPLQTMQIYALGTGSLMAGALSMFLFSLGTVPLLLGFGAISAFLSAKFNRRMLKASGVLVMALGLVMFTRGLNLFGVALPSLSGNSGLAVAKVSGGYQMVRTTIESGQYHPFVVQAGIPVKWTITVKAEDLNGCNNPVTIPQYGIRKQLVPGDNLIEFTPEREGGITYTCWMGMISSVIHVVRDLNGFQAADLTAASATDIASAFGSGGGGGGGCCGATPGRFAGGKIPVDSIQVAALTGEGQVAEVVVNDNGYTPAVIVVKKGVKAKIRFVPERLTTCNYIVSFPEYQGALDLSQGQLETPYLEVVGDFTFQCGMGMLHGYVKAVDDPSVVDMKAVKRDVAAYIPAAGGGCCGG